jgi:two-component system sensor histidine kinase PrrB
MMKSSLSVRVTAGVLVVVAAVLIGGGFLIIRVTEQRDRRDAGGELQRIAGNLTPWVAGTLGIGRPPNSPGSAVPLQLLDAQGQPVVLPPPPNGSLPPPPNGSLPPPPNRPPPPGLGLEPLRDAFAASGDRASPVGQIAFVRAVNPQNGERLILGTVPRGFPAMWTRPGMRTTAIAGTHWRSAVINGPAGLLIEVGAPEQISARAAKLRTTVIWTTIAGLAIALVATLLVTRRALRPLKVLRRKAAHISDVEDLGTRVQQPGQPSEVAALAGELDGMLARLDSAVAAREQALVAARRFAADAGHELRTPLQTIRSNLDIARSPDASQDEQKLALEVATRQSERMNRLVDGLQSLARGEAGLVQSGTEVDLGDIADSAAYVTRTRHPELSIDVDLPESGPTVTGDGDGLWRVIENLLENAARHGRPGGHITMQVASLNGGAEILVDDDGPGIPPAERQRVMRRFQRGPGATAAGSGLGLAIVEAEANRHGGRLSLDTSRLGGLRARVSIQTR